MDAYQFANIGYVITDVDDNVLSILKDKANTLKQNFTQGIDYNNNLAGNIKKEFDLTDIKAQCEPFILNACKFYKENYPAYKPQIVRQSPIVLKDFWINFQSKHEFNPVHNHTGLFSFVIWLDIPYDINDELTKGPGHKSNNNLAGHFEFAFRNTLGEHTTLPIPADKKFNGKICIFPSAMTHTVYPFYTSDDYRITVSGNINFSD
jgi:hypothetical protein